MQSALAFALAIEAVLAASSSSPTAVRPTSSLIEPAFTQIEASAATATALSPVSNVPGVGFDRFVQIWLENTV
jgi:acid phosphatase